MGKVINKLPCPTCKAKGGDWDNDNRVVYSDMSTYCWPCDIATPATRELSPGEKQQISEAEQHKNDFIEGTCLLIENRGISEATCKYNSYRTGEFYGREVYIEEWVDYDKLVGQKIRTRDKKFFWIRRPDPLFMYNLHNPNHSHKEHIIICEGALDALSCEEVGFQAISTIDGGNKTGKNIENDLKRDYKELIEYNKIILFLDNPEIDTVGRGSLQKALDTLPSDKVVVVTDYRGLKDANDLLLAGVLKEVLENTINPPPSNIIYGRDIDINELQACNIKSIEIPWPQLNESMLGFEYGCLYILLAGSGVGKSTILRELGTYYSVKYPDLKIANFFLEENDKVTPQAYLATYYNVPLGHLRRNPQLLTKEQWAEGQKLFFSNENLAFIDKRYEKTTTKVLKDIEYLVKVKKFDLIFIDHISYLIGRTGVSKHGERRDVDEFLYKLQDLVQSLGCIIIAVSHVNESQSAKRWDQGEVPNIYSGRSSKAIAQVPDGIIGGARNMTNDRNRDELSLYNLKNRWFSKLGKCDTLDFITDTGRLLLRPIPKTATELFLGAGNERN